MASPLWEIQEAVYQKFTNDASLTALVKGVFDAVPEYEDFPYIQIGYFTEVNKNTFDKSGKEVTMLLHVFSTYQGNKELYQIRNAIDNLLDRKRGADRLDLGPKHYLIDCHVEFADVLEEATDKFVVRHLVLRYRLLTVEK